MIESKSDSKNTLELISDITEFNDLHEFMKDEHLDKALLHNFGLLGYSRPKCGFVNIFQVKKSFLIQNL